MSRPVTTVAVVGRDAALWLSALALDRAFRRAGVVVTAVELPSRLAEADVYVGLPQLDGLHVLLGLETDEAVGVCSGTFSFGQRLSNWNPGRPAFVHAYDTCGVALDRVDFVQYWTKARAEGLNVALEDFSVGAAAAKQGRFVQQTEESQKISSAAAGVHLDAPAYVRRLKRLAAARRLPVEQVETVRVETEGERVVALRLPNGRTLAADLWVDATGPDALLHGRLAGSEFQSWTDRFPCDRKLVVSGARLRPTPAFAEIGAFRAGWTALHPLQDRTAGVAWYDSSQASDAAAAEALALAGLRPEGEGSVTPVTTGARPRPWIGNCVAVGEAAARVEPLDGVELHLVHQAVSNLVAFFPLSADGGPEAVAYNRLIGDHLEHVRDFQFAHYLLNGRRDEPFWDRARSAAPGARLAERLRAFEARGVMPTYDHETFDEASWIGSFVGHGRRPRDYDPLVDRMPVEDQIRAFQRLLAVIAEAVRESPSLDAHLEFHAPAPGSAAF